jgi:hypothetical protein
MKRDKVSLVIIAALIFLCFVALAKSLSAQQNKPIKGGKIQRLSSEERMLLGTKLCEVHSEELKLDVVPIHYGLIRLKADYIKARETQFPQANSSLLGGCIVMDVTKAEVLYCTRCREAESAWRNIHDKE